MASARTAAPTSASDGASDLNFGSDFGTGGS
ncbi:hypothetical protein ABIB35_000085 [Arthrobacter sp. UYP6]